MFGGKWNHKKQAEKSHVEGSYCPEKLAHFACCGEILIRVRGTWPSSGAFAPVGMLNVPDKASRHFSVAFVIVFSSCLLIAGFKSGFDHF